MCAPTLPVRGCGVSVDEVGGGSGARPVGPNRNIHHLYLFPIASNSDF